MKCAVLSPDVHCIFTGCRRITVFILHIDVFLGQILELNFVFLTYILSADLVLYARRINLNQSDQYLHGTTVDECATLVDSPPRF